MKSEKQVAIELRTPRIADIPGILAVVRSGGPFLTAHAPYIYWMQIRLDGEICAVAVRNSKIVGWCSVARGHGRRYFIHQLGVAPNARSQGVARALLMQVVTRVKERSGTPELEFTVDRRNGAALELVKAVAARAGMQLQRAGEPLQLLDEDCAEDLYTMTVLGKRRTDISNEVPDALWTTTERTEATVTTGSNF